MSVEQILTYLVLAGVLVAELLRYLQNRSSKSVEDSLRSLLDEANLTIHDYKDTIREMASGLRDSIPQETFSLVINSLEAVKRGIDNDLVDSVANTAENLVKYADSDPANDPTN